MIPYSPPLRTQAFGLTFHAFGVLAAAALLIGLRAIPKRAVRLGLGFTEAARMTVNTLCWGFLGSHVLYLVVVDPVGLASRPSRLFNPLDGIYSFGVTVGQYR